MKAKKLVKAYLVEECSDFGDRVLHDFRQLSDWDKGPVALSIHGDESTPALTLLIRNTQVNESEYNSWYQLSKPVSYSDVAIVIRVASVTEVGHIDADFGQRYPCAQLRVVLVPGELEGYYKSELQNAHLVIGYNQGDKLNDLLQDIGLSFLSRPQQLIYPLVFDSYIAVDSDRAAALSNFPLWEGFIDVYRPCELIDACKEPHLYVLIKKNLEIMREDPRYLWYYHQSAFTQACTAAAEHKQIGYLLLLFTYLPSLGFSFPASTPLAMVQRVIEERKEKISCFLRKYQLTDEELDKIKSFDGDSYAQTFLTEAPIPMGLMNYKFLKALRDAISNNDIETIKQFGNRMIRYPSCIQGWSRDLARLIMAYYTDCLVSRNLELWLLLYTLSELAGLRVYGTLTPYEHYQRVLSWQPAEIKYSVEELQALAQITPEEVEKNGYEPPFTPSKKPIVNTTEGDRIPLRRYIEIADELALLCEQLAKMRLVLERTSIGDGLKHHRGLRQALSPLRRLDQFKKVLVNQNNFAQTRVYRVLVQAADEDDPRQVNLCLERFVANQVDLGDVLTYKNCANEERTYADTKRNEPVISRIFTNRSYLVLRLLAQREDTLPVVQSFIRYRTLTGLVRETTYIAEVCYHLLTDPQRALALFDSEAVKLDRYRIDLGSLRQWFSYNRRWEIAAAIDKTLAPIMAANMALLTRRPEVLYHVATSVRRINPKSALLYDLFLPLSPIEAGKISTTLSCIENPPCPLDDLNLVGVQIKYLFHQFQLNRIYTLCDPHTGDRQRVRLYPFGQLAISTNEQDLCGPKPLSDTLLTFGKLGYSGQHLDLLIPTGPKTKIQSPAVKGGQRGVFHAYALGRHGFWGSAQRFGDEKQPIKQMVLQKYDALVTGGCMMGATFYADGFNAQGALTTITLTDPKAPIPMGFKVEKIRHEGGLHPYETYTIAQLGALLPALKKVNPLICVYYDLPTTNYILYGVHYYLHAVLDIEKFKAYVRQIRSHHSLLRGQLDKLQQDLQIQIVTRSTLDNLGFISEKEPEEIIAFVENFPGVKDATDPVEKECAFVQALIETQRKQPDLIGTVYGYADEARLGTLVDLNQFDYAALYAFAKLKYHANGAGDVLGLMPADEELIFEKYHEVFGDLGALDTLLWLPNILPQHSEISKARIFFLESGINTVNHLILKGLVNIQSTLIAAIHSDDSRLYLATLQELVGLLIKVEQELSKPALS